MSLSVLMDQREDNKGWAWDPNEAEILYTQTIIDSPNILQYLLYTRKGDVVKRVGPGKMTDICLVSEIVTDGTTCFLVCKWNKPGQPSSSFALKHDPLDMAVNIDKSLLLSRQAPTQ